MTAVLGLATALAAGQALAAPADPPASAPTTAGTSASASSMAVTDRPKPKRMGERTYRYLTRPVGRSARHLDHGVIEVSGAGGWPHRYRLGVGIGLFDHLSLGVTAHWLGGQSRPQVSPRIAVAFYRWRLFEIGAIHFWSMYPPPVRDVDPATDSFQPRAQWTLASLTFGQRFISGGVDAGAVRARVQDPSMEPMLDNESIIRWRFGGGLHLRAGTRRWGFTAQAHLPYATAELMFDVRFGAFELRPRGGWSPAEELRATDRRMPQRRSIHDPE